MTTDDQDREDEAARFAREAEEAPPGFLAELIAFLGSNKRWWLAPILIVLLIVGLLIVLGGTALAPFIYPLF